MSGGSGVPGKPRRVRVGPYRVTPATSSVGDSRVAIAGRYRRYLRDSSVGPREVSDPDESVRVVPPRSGQPAGVQRGFGLPPDQDDDE